MVPPIDVFKVLIDGQLRWIEAVQDVETAKLRVIALGKISPGQYVVFNQNTGNKLVVET